MIGHMPQKAALLVVLGGLGVLRGFSAALDIGGEGFHQLAVAEVSCLVSKPHPKELSKV